ncbi:unnamed protein product, partial [Vitis vinifera]
MNIFRLAGDMTHLASVLVLLLKIHTIKSCAGISLKTQELYALVFATRYLDIFTDYISLYNTVMKLIFLGSSFSIVWYIRHHKIVRRSYDKDQDTFRHFFLVLPCLLLALVMNEKFTFLEVLWAFSLYLEAVAILPQLVLLQRTRNIDNLTGQYVFLLGIIRVLILKRRQGFRALYIKWKGLKEEKKISIFSGGDPSRSSPGMSSFDLKNSKKDFVWKYVIEVAGEQYLRCKFCNQRCTGGVNRLKHHLAGTHHGMKPCNKVSEDAKLECKEALANFKDQKTKRNELFQEIGMGPTSMHESALSKTIGTLGSGSGSGSVSGSGEPIPRGPMNKFTTSQPRQTTLNSKWKQEERKEGSVAYRALYILNWIYRYFTEPHYVHWITWISGLVQTLLYADFFYYYFHSWKNNEKLHLPA